MASATGTLPPPDRTAKARARRQLDLAVRGWFAATALGQLLFVIFIVLFYYTSVIRGDYAVWNTKPLITGYVQGDATGNMQFALHVLAAAAMTTAGLVQLVPAIRNRWPRVHRWSGRLFLSTALILALGGLWLTWIRGSYLNVWGAIAITMDAGLILWFAFMAWRMARQRNFAAHRRWALRTFMVASGVWFIRIGYMVWGMTTGGAGTGSAMSGPFDIFWAFGAHLLPLAGLELYLRAERGTARSQLVMAGGLWLATLAILGGSAGAWLVMWWPHIAA